MTPRLRLTLLGGFRAFHHGEPLRHLDSLRLQSLLAFLVLRSGVPQDRQHLAFTFWPETTEAQARTNLRQLYHLLRRALPAPDRFVAADRRTLLWLPTAPVDIDVVELHDALVAADRAAARNDTDDVIEASERAASLYAGELLPSCYDAWIEPHRDRLRARTVAALARLVDLLEAREDYGSALAAARRLLAVDPFREESHQALIRVHSSMGDAGLAARAYRDCVALFERELAVAPGPETRALFEDLRPGGESTIPAFSETAAPAPTVVGRDPEWRRLLTAWRRARDGRAELVLLSGEPGIGKTHLAREFVARAGADGAVAAEARCYAAEGLLAYDAVAQWLRSDALQPRVAALDVPWRTELGRVLLELASADEEPVPAEAAAESRRRARLFEALARAALGGPEPLVLFLDDLQWCDGDTLAWIHYLMRFDPAAPVLVLATLRTGEAAADDRLPAWLLQVRAAAKLSEIELGPLDCDATAKLAAAIAGADPDPQRAERLHVDTEGNPLFVVETVRTWAADERGEGAATTHELAARAPIPAKIRSVIAARLARLSPAARDLVGLAATVGRDFTLPVLRRAGEPGANFVAALEELLDRHLVRERHAPALDFSHDKIREVAYDELSAPRRALMHERVARALEASAVGRLDDIAGEIARHLERAGRGPEAIPYHRRAAERALAMYASEEAAGHLSRALRLLEAKPESTARDEIELELQTALGAALVVTDHYSGQRVWDVYRRARALGERIGRTPPPPVLRALALASLMRSRLVDVLELGRALLRAAERDRDPMLDVEAHYVMGVALYWHGRVAPACRHLERALERYAPARAGDHLRLYTQDPSIICGIRLALARWHAGEPDAARDLCLAMLARAEGLGHPFSLAYARYFGSWVLIETGDLESTRRHLRLLIDQSREHGLATWPTLGTILDGWVRAEDGDPEGGLRQMRRAAADYAAMEVDLGFPYHQSLYARICRRTGRALEARAALDEALAMAERTRERFWDAELHRLKGELLLDGGAAGAARAPLSHALAIARGQGAVTLERRAAASLARLERPSRKRRTLQERSSTNVLRRTAPEP